MRLGQSTESVTDDRSANYSSDLCFEKPHTQWAFPEFLSPVLVDKTNPTAFRAAVVTHFDANTKRYRGKMDFWDVVTEALTMMWHVHPARFQPAGQGPGHRRHGRHRTGFAAGALIGGLITIFFALETKGWSSKNSPLMSTIRLSGSGTHLLRSCRCPWQLRDSFDPGVRGGCDWCHPIKSPRGSK